ncbi:hypothetical protein KUCAC02_012829 [Chaenocephalus aceratus]|uniref:Uncharacterized protein n=1 Tax=Chaenocephalus aceratus TaxID=36190 RepID=A0ACB9XDM2_CHAAC|nr:hypothetical protein KUCAC02_012829 [Chaenocephalus aceratus]
MENKRRNAYDAAFKLKAVNLAVKEGHRAAARTLGINESMVRRWRRQREELSQCKKSKKAFRGNKSRWPELEDFLEDWVNTQRADGRGVSTVQIRLKAKTVATEMKIENVRGGPSWCFRFMRQKGLSIRARTTVCQQLPPYQEKITNFGEFTQRKIEEYSIGPDQILNMDEVPLAFDLPLTRTVNKKGESSITLRTTGHERTNFTCVLGCTASGLKLPPMVIFKRITMPKEKIPNGISFKVNKKGWMMESVMKEWLNECYVKRPGGFFARFGQHEGPYNRFCESSHRDHKLNSSCDSWGHNEASAATRHQCQSCVQKEDAATAEALQRLFDSDSYEEEFVGFESDNEGERRVADEATLSLFVSDTEDEDFGGFSTQEEDEDED